MNALRKYTPTTGDRVKIDKRCAKKFDIPFGNYIVDFDIETDSHFLTTLMNGDNKYVITEDIEKCLQYKGKATG